MNRSDNHVGYSARNSYWMNRARVTENENEKSWHEMGIINLTNHKINCNYVQ